jgi:hypothetical protein
MRQLPLLLALVLAACSATPSPSLPASSDEARDVQVERVKEALADDFGMTFESAGPQHELGKAPDGVELDLVGSPVEEVVLSVPRDDPRLGLQYVPHLRDILHGPGPVYEWAENAFRCHAEGRDRCTTDFARGTMTASLDDGGDGKLELILTRR